MRKYYDGTIEEAFKIDFDDIDKLYNFCKELYVKENNHYVNAIDKINELVTMNTSIDQKVIIFYKENNSEKYDVSKTDIIIDDSIVPSGVYSNNKLLKKVRFTSNVRKINAHAFENCINLEKVTFENGLKEIGAFAFANTNIDSVVLPNSLERIGTKDGYENGKYTDLTSFVSNKPFKKVSFPPYGEYMAEAFNEYAHDCEIDLPIFELNTYSNSKFSKLHLKEIYIRKGTTEIPDYFIKDDPYVEVVRIPSSVYDISRHAFVNCKNLREITFERKDKEYNPIDYCIDCPVIEEKNVVRRDKVICKDGYILCKKVYDENSFDEFKKLILIFNNYFAWDGHNRVDDKFENIKNYEDFINVAISKTKAVTYSFDRKYKEQKEFMLFYPHSSDVYLSKCFSGKKEKISFLESDDFALVLDYARYTLMISKTEMVEKRYYRDDYFMENENLEGIIYFSFNGKMYCVELDYEPWD